MKKLLLVLTAFVITFTVNAQDTAVSIEEEYKVNISYHHQTKKRKRLLW